MKRKKIAFIIQHLTNGGAERTISNLSFELSKNNDVTLIVFDGNNVTYPYQGQLIDLKIPPKDGVGNKIVNVIKRIHYTKKLRKKYKFDCVISFMFGANIVNVLSKQSEKVIVSARNFMSAYGVKRKDIIRERFIARHSDIEVGLSKLVSYDLVHTFGIPEEKVVTIYNPCDINRIGNLGSKKVDYFFDENIFYFVTAGRFVKQKGQWHLLKAFSILHKKIKNIRLIILGDGELREELKKLAINLNIDDAVDFIGFIDNPYAYIAKSSCFVLSSLFEGLGNVIIEAMACKTPVISYDCLAGPRELLAPDSDFCLSTKGVEKCPCGILVERPGQTINITTQVEQEDENLARAMLMIYDNSDLRTEIINNAYNRIKEFLPEKINDNWQKIF